MMTLEDFKTTGDYNRMYNRVRSLLDISSGVLPSSSAFMAGENTFVEIIPVSDGRVQTAWAMIFINKDAKGTFGFYDSCTVSKKRGKLKAAEKFTDVIVKNLWNCVNDRKEA